MKTKKVTKAVIPAAGFGTRFLPQTKAMPKEMLPIVDKPVIQYVVEELVEAGIKDIFIVTGYHKRGIEDHFDAPNLDLIANLKMGGKKKKHLLESVEKISEMANFVYVRQKGPYGNGTPVLSASNIVKNEPFMYVWGDDLVKSKTSFSKQMIEDYNKTGLLMIGVQEVPENQVDRYGIVKLKENTTQIIDIIEKPDINKAPSRLADFGRMILNQDIIDILKNTNLGKDNELWIVDAIRNYIKGGGEFYAKKVEDGEWITTGDPLNYLKANLKYAFNRDDINSELKEFCQQFLSKSIE